MMKSYVQELSRVYSALFEDAKNAFPTLERELERDLTRLQASVEQRGIPVYLVDLPALGKHLDRCLSSGAYKLSGLPLSKRYSRRVPIPKFLRGLYLRVFETDGSLKEDYDVEAIFFLRQILLAAKKTALQCSGSRVRDEVHEFFRLDATLPKPSKFWERVGPTPQDCKETFAGFAKDPRYLSRGQCIMQTPIKGVSTRYRASHLLGMLDDVSGILSSTLGFYDPDEWNFKHGPGVVSDRQKFTNKYYWKNWSFRLEAVFPLARYGFHSYSAWADCAPRHYVSSVEPTSVLMDVPKTFLKPRLIAAEPSEMMWCQQNVKHYLYSRVEASWISDFIRFTDQSLNQDLCTLGSREGNLVTVDLSAASDCVTCQAVGNMFRANSSLLLALQATRTQYVDQGICKDLPLKYKLRKFSTMGNATTFPVESLIFLAITLTAALACRGKRVTVRNLRDLQGQVAVFGDDIIAPSDSREVLYELLEVLDFKVNTDKSHWTGRFRESCGVDSFGGVTVTPAYWKAPYSGEPDSYATAVTVSNNFYSKFLVNTAAAVMSTVKGESIPLVQYGSGFCGLKSFVPPPISGFPTRYNEELQRTEIKVTRLLGKSPRSPANDDSAALQFFTEQPDPHEEWVSGVPQRPSLRKRKGWVPVTDVANL